MINFSLLATAIRVLSMDAVEKAKSGHPGMPMGMADIGTVLWKNHLQHNPLNPNWANRDRFILSNGHGSMLLYSLLHLSGYALSLKEIENFRQLNSKTPGHPEYQHTVGVETSTGPLGQGIANAVGMALAEKLLATTFNKPNLNIINHYTYVFLGDGCLMEGISHEACSLAGTLKLNKLILIYDDNGISIDGHVIEWFNEDVIQRFKAYHWNVIANIDGHNIEAIDNAIIQAKQSDKPSLIICKTIIGKGSPNKSGKEDAHGAPLGKDEIELVRKELNWPFLPFEIPQEVYQQFDAKEQGKQIENEWNILFNKYSATYPELAKEFLRRINHQLPSNWNEIVANGIKKTTQAQETIATRKASQNAIEYFAQFLPELFGGSADLTGSNLTRWSNALSLNHENNFNGNYLSYGVREFAMTAMLNGIYLHGGFKPFGGTFLMFSEYARNAIRMASLMRIAPIFVYSHDSIGVGEDGPTHQPIEQIATLRLIPNINLWRPADTTESMVAWADSLKQNHRPSCLVLSRQNLKYIERNEEQINNIAKGGYILRCNSAQPEILIMATGSELELALNAYDYLSAQHKLVQLVSMPSLEVFAQQDQDYKNKVLGGEQCKYKIAIEAGVNAPWYQYVGANGLILGINSFGVSAKSADVFDYFGLTTTKVINKIKDYIN
ncbi:MAG: transketolase [Pseudomonadota bacterium]|jgi:transketolase|nr:transketolase [Burkholderiales bacterium]